MILGCKTKDEAKEEAKAHQDIAANPNLQKTYGVLSRITELQNEYPMLNEVTEAQIGFMVIPAPVVQFISQGVWKYTFTTVPANPLPGTGLNTTWVKVTKISWV